jgi:chemotaxis protein methyltransferase CheR
LKAQQDYPFSDADFRLIAEVAKVRFGLDLASSKKPLVYSRLAKRLRALNLHDFAGYCRKLQDDQAADEIAHFLSALTTNVTHFFREMHHFQFLADTLAPHLIAKAKSGEEVRIWSAACSAGQEAYCIAAALLLVEPRITDFNIRILATDIDPKMISVAKSGEYDTEQLQAIPPEFRSTMIGSTTSDTKLQMHSRLSELISFAELNLIARWPMQKQYDVIFCRNVAIYFDKATQATLWQRFGEVLKNDGHLMIGHSERLSGPAITQFQSVGVTTYTKGSMTTGSGS